MTQPELGKNLRAARLRLGRSLAEVAAATGVSPSFISMVENGNSDISIGRLLRLTQNYGVEIGEVVPGPGPVKEEVVRADRRQSLALKSEGLEIHFLTDTQLPLRPLLVEFAPGGGMIEPVRDSGDAFLYLLRGEIVVEVDDLAPVVLREGDSVYLPGAKGRLYRNETTAPALLLSVVLRQDVVGNGILDPMKAAVAG